MAAVAAIDAKVGIGGEDDGIGERFGHAHEARIGKTHGYACVFPHEHQHRLEITGQIERKDHGTAAKKRAQSGPATSSEKVERFGQNGLAGFPGPCELRRLGQTIRKSIRLGFRRAEPTRREQVRKRSHSAYNRPYVHAGFRLPKGKPLSARVVSRISAQLPSNLAQRSEQGKCIPVAWLSRRGTFSVRQLRRYREPGDRYRGAASWHAGANSRERAADCARWRAAPTTPGARGCAE